MNRLKEAKSSVIAAQTADTMVAISGIYVSVVIVEYVDGSLGISARSDGTVNVQIVWKSWAAAVIRLWPAYA